MDQMTDYRIQTDLDWDAAFGLHLDQKYRHGSSRTVDLARQHLRVFSQWWQAVNGCEFDPMAVASVDLQEYRQHSLKDARVAGSTWNSRLWALRLFSEWIGIPELTADLEIQRAGHVLARHRSLDPTEYRRLSRTLEIRIRGAVTEQQQRSMIRDAAAVALMVWAGLRVDEVAQLDHDDIRISERSGSVKIRHGKGDKLRMVPLGQQARRALASWLQISAGSGALITGKGSSRLTTRQLERIVKQIGWECQVPEMTPHWLRYTFAKRLDGHDATIEQIRDLLGHGSIETTRRYLQSGYTELQSIVDLL